jgi:hypothetical protein
MSSISGLAQLVNESMVDQYLSTMETEKLFETYQKSNKLGKTSTRIDFETAPALQSGNSELVFISNNLKDGSEDLLSKVYFCCELPEIYSDRSTRFKWIKNIGIYLIKEVEFTFSQNSIQKFTADWLNIWNELTCTDDKSYQNILGNSEENNNPTEFRNKKIVIRNNKFEYAYYPESSQDTDKPSIKKTKLCINIPFWFSTELGNALPMIFFQTVPIQIRIKLEDPELLYTIYSEKLDQDISPLLYNELEGTSLNINSFLKNDIKDINNINIRGYIQKTGYVLGEYELSELGQKGFIDYIMNDIMVIEKDLDLGSTDDPVEQSIEMDIINKPIKELVWIIRRDDIITNFNNHINYTASYNTNSKYDILNYATYRIENSIDIFNELETNYLTVIQPKIHHTNLPRIGNIYLYSFAKNPESKDSTGHFNPSNVNNKLKIKVNTFSETDEQFNINIKLRKITQWQNQEKEINNYKIKIFANCYNFVTISANQANKKLN